MKDVILRNDGTWKRIVDLDHLVQLSLSTRFSGLEKEYYVRDGKLFFTYGENNTFYVSPVRPEALEILQKKEYSLIELHIPSMNSDLEYYFNEKNLEECLEFYKMLEADANEQNRIRASYIAYSYASANKRISGNLLNVRVPNNQRFKVTLVTKAEVIENTIVEPMLLLSSDTGEVVSDTLENVCKYDMTALSDDDYLIVYCDKFGDTYAVRGELEDIMDFEYSLIYSGYVSYVRVEQ